MPLTPEERQRIISDLNQPTTRSLTPEQRSMMLADLKGSTPEIPREEIEGEIPTLERARLSFASSPEEEMAALEQKYPGLLKGTRSMAGKQVPLVKFPGEQKYKYIDQPGFTLKDIADVAGELPSVGLGVGSGLIGSGAGPGGAFAAGAAGSAAGEAAKKYIGREYLGIPKKQSTEEDVTDIAVSGGVGGAANLLPGALSYGKGMIKSGLSKLGIGAAKPVASELGQEAVETTTKPIVKEAAQDVVVPPKTLADIKAATTGIEDTLALPTKKELRQAEQALPDLKTKPTELHYKALDDKTSQDIIRLRREVGDETARSLNLYDQKIKKDAESIVDNEIQKKIGSRTKISDPIASGDQITDAVLKKYNSVKKELGPVFESFEKARVPRVKHIPALREKIIADVPSLQNAVGIDTEGKLILTPWSADLGIDRASYSLLDDAFSALNKDKISVKQIQNIRETLRQSLDPVNPNPVITRLRSSLLGHIDNLIKAKKPSAKVYETFKAYAKNEKALDDLEYVVKGKLTSLDPTQMAPKDKMLDRIFADQKTAQIAKDVLGEKEFSNVVGDYIALLKQRATKDGVLSPHRFQSMLDKKATALQEHVPKNIAKRIRAANTIMRLAPDAPSPNTSGTAKSMGLLRKITEGGVGSIPGNVTGMLKEATSEAAARREINKILGGVSEAQKPGLLDSLKSIDNPYVKSVLGGLLKSGGASETRGLLREGRK